MLYLSAFPLSLRVNGKFSSMMSTACCIAWISRPRQGACLLQSTLLHLTTPPANRRCSTTISIICRPNSGGGNGGTDGNGGYDGDDDSNASTVEFTFENLIRIEGIHQVPNPTSDVGIFDCSVARTNSSASATITAAAAK